MRKIIFILTILFASVTCFSQSIVPRANSSYTVQDSRFSAALNLFVPRYADTTAANAGTAEGIDSLGAVIYTYDVQALWVRRYDSGKKWAAIGGGGGGSGTVTSVGWAGGIVSIANPTTTPAFTIAGTSGGIPYFSSSSTWATSAALAANSLIIGGGAGSAPSSITTGTGILTALGVNIGSAGAPVLFNGAGGTPSSITLTNGTGLSLSTGVTGDLPFANLTQGSARSVLGVTGNATADFASIQGTANQVLVINPAGTALAFGQVNLSSSSAVTGTLPSSFTAAHGIDDVLAVGQSIDGVDRVMYAINSGEVSMIAKETLVSPYGAEVNAISGVGNSRIILKVDNVDGEFSLRMGVDGSFEIADDRVGTPALQYFANYAAGFTDRSIIDKGYYLNLEADRTVNLGGFFLKFQNSGQNYLSLDPANGQSLLRAFNSTGAGNQARVLSEATNTDATFTVEADFNDGVKIATIEALANTSTATITYTADTHTFTGAMRLVALAGNGTGVVAVDNDGDLSWLATPSGGGITIGTTTITSGTTTRVLFNNAGVVGEYTISGTGSVAMTASPTFTGTLTMATPFTLGATSVTSTGTQLNYLNAATGTTGTTSTNIVFSASPTFTGTVTMPTPFTLGATSVTSTGTQLNYLNAATGTTGTTSSNVVFSATSTFTGTTTIATLSVTGFSTLAGGFSTNATAGNSNMYVTGSIAANRNTTASLLPLSAAGIGLRASINGTTAYAMTASDAFASLDIGTTGGVTEAASGTHPIIASLVVRPITVTNGAGATDILAGVYIEGPATGVTPATASYGLWVDAGLTRLDAGILLGAGTATAGTAPLKFTSGTNLTVVENGAMEYDGTNYFVSSGAARYTVAKTLTATATLNFGSTAAGAAADLTITVTGAAVGDAVYVGVDNASVTADNIAYWGWISATNTATVRFNNNNLVSAVDPASGTFRVVVTKY